MSDHILRTFIAIELDEAIRIALGRVQGLLKRQVPPNSVRWVSPDAIHLTLKFLGDTPRSRIGQIEGALGAAVAGLSPFEIGVEGRGCFPNFRRPRVIWVAVRDKGRMLARLQTAVEKEVAPLGWPAEERSFSPHLTLGRVSRDAGSREAAAAGQAVEASIVEQIGRQRVSEISLIQSELRPTGAVYTRLAGVWLSAPDSPP